MDFCDQKLRAACKEQELKRLNITGQTLQLDYDNVKNQGNLNKFHSEHIDQLQHRMRKVLKKCQVYPPGTKNGSKLPPDEYGIALKQNNSVLENKFQDLRALFSEYTVYNKVEPEDRLSFEEFMQI